MIRRAEQRDLFALAGIAEVVGLDAFHVRALEEDLRAPHALVLAAEDDRGVLGFAVSWVIADEGSLLAIAVHPEAQRRGAGRALLEESERWARERGATTMFLEVRASNSGARRFYAVEGYEETGVRAGYYSDGENAVLMRRSIA